MLSTKAVKRGNATQSHFTPTATGNGTAPSHASHANHPQHPAISLKSQPKPSNHAIK